MDFWAVIWKKEQFENTENSISLYPFSDNPGQNVLGHLRKLGTKTHFAKLTHILPLKKAWGCCYKGLFLLSPSPPSSVDCVELKLEYITSTLHRGGRGEGRCLNLTSYCVSVPRVFLFFFVFWLHFRPPRNCLIPFFERQFFTQMIVERRASLKKRH